GQLQEPVDQASKQKKSDSAQQAASTKATKEQQSVADDSYWKWLALALLLAIISAGFYRGIRHAKHHVKGA
ncbi:MAG: hypothetical protein ACKVJE_17545, partial [Pseudomonadales bacterium]